MIQALADAVLEGEERFTIQLLSPKNEPVIDPVRGLTTYYHYQVYIMCLNFCQVVFKVIIYLLFFPSGVATVVIQADVGALGTVGIADSSRNILIGEPRDIYNGTALVR